MTKKTSHFQRAKSINRDNRSLSGLIAAFLIGWHCPLSSKSQIVSRTMPVFHLQMPKQIFEKFNVIYSIQIKYKLRKNKLRKNKLRKNKVLYEEYNENVFLNLRL